MNGGKNGANQSMHFGNDFYKADGQKSKGYPNMLGGEKNVSNSYSAPFGQFLFNR